MKSNKTRGNEFEKKFVTALAGYRKGTNWIHILKDNANGQPFDVIEVYNGIAFGYDCKLTKGGVFRHNRLEVNQHLAFKRLKEAGGYASLAIGYECEPNSVYIIPYIYAVKDISIEEAADIASCIIQLG